jgi:hypothetical protein
VHQVGTLIEFPSFEFVKLCVVNRGRPNVPGGSLQKGWQTTSPESRSRKG